MGNEATNGCWCAALCLQDNLGALDYLCIVAKVALLVQKRGQLLQVNAEIYKQPVILK